MHLLTLLLPLSALASGLSLPTKRDYSTIQSDVALLNNASIPLAIVALHAGPSDAQAGATLGAMNHLGENFALATSHPNASSILTESQTSDFISRVRSSLGTLREGLPNVALERNEYNQGGKIFISLALGTLFSSATRYAGAIVTKAPAASRGAAMALSCSFGSAASSAASAFAAK